MKDANGHEFRGGDTVSANWAPSQSFQIAVARNLSGEVITFGLSGRIHADEAHRWTILRRADGKPTELDTGVFGSFVEKPRALAPCGCVGRTCPVCAPATESEASIVGVLVAEYAIEGDYDGNHPIRSIVRRLDAATKALAAERDDYRRQLETAWSERDAALTTVERMRTVVEALTAYRTPGTPCGWTGVEKAHDTYLAATKPTKEQRTDAVLKALLDKIYGCPGDVKAHAVWGIAAGEEIARIKAES